MRVLSGSSARTLHFAFFNKENFCGRRSRLEHIIFLLSRCGMLMNMFSECNETHVNVMEIVKFRELRIS